MNLIQAAYFLRRLLAYLCLLLIIPSAAAPAQKRTKPKQVPAIEQLNPDSIKKSSVVTARSTNPNAYRIILRAVDISRFPEISVILDARDREDRFYPGLKKSDLIIYHDEKPRQITGLETISSKNSLPVDIVFVIDQTGSMRHVVNEVKTNVGDFTMKLSSNGIDYRLGLVTFSDRVERRREFTNDVKQFIDWVDGLTVAGGGDANENALEGIREALTLKFRPSAQRIVILITDAMYHQLGDHGDGTTTFTTQTIADFLVKNAVRLYAVTPPASDYASNPGLKDYEYIVQRTHGQKFDIIQDFSSILSGFTASLSNLYAVKYKLTETVPPEAANIEILNSDNEVMVREKVELLGVDKKFIIDHILFDFDKASLNQTYIPELKHVLAMMQTYPTIQIEIQGHTDDIGSNEYNIALSEARALAVKKYFVTNGVNADRIKTRGLGKDLPIAPNDTEEGRQLNRRTEIVITKK